MTDTSVGADAPVVEQQPSVHADAPAPEGTANPDAEKPEEGEGTPAKTPRTYTEDELAQALRKRLGYESRRQRRVIEAELRAEFAERQLREQQAPQTKATSEAPGRPQPNDFDDAEKYQRALLRWEVRDEIRLENEERERTTREKKDAQAERERATQFEERIFGPGREKYGDEFEDLVMSTTITKAMADAIADSDCAVDLAHYLGNNPGEAKKIAALSDSRQVRELAKIEAKLTAPAPTTRAPAPITPTGANAPSTKDTKEMSDDDWMRWRESELKKKRA